MICHHNTAINDKGGLANLAEVAVHLCKLGSHRGSVGPMHMADVIQAEVVRYQHVPVIRRADRGQQLLRTGVQVLVSGRPCLAAGWSYASPVRCNPDEIMHDPWAGSSSSRGCA